MDAGTWIGEKMETLHARLGRKKTSSEQKSEHHLRPGLWRSRHRLPLIEFDPHLLFKIACGPSDASEDPAWVSPGMLASVPLFCLKVTVQRC